MTTYQNMAVHITFLLLNRLSWESTRRSVEELRDLEEIGASSDGEHVLEYGNQEIASTTGRF